MSASPANHELVSLIAAMARLLAQEANRLDWLSVRLQQTASPPKEHSSPRRVAELQQCFRTLTTVLPLVRREIDHLDKLARDGAVGEG